jgi:hypothetical protein
MNPFYKKDWVMQIEQASRKIGAASISKATSITSR